MRLRTKNFLFVSLVIGLVITLSFGLLYFMLPEYYKSYKQEMLNQDITEITKNLNKPTGAELKKVVKQADLDLQKQGDSLLPTIWLIMDSESRIVYVTEDAAIQMTTANEENATSDSTITDKTANIKKFYDDQMSLVIGSSADFVTAKKKIQTKDKGTYQFFILSPVQPINEAKTVLIRIYPLFLVISLVIGGIGAFIYSKYSTKRLRKLSSATRELMEMDNKTVALVDHHADEIGELSQDIQTLYDKWLATIDDLHQKMKIIEENEESKTDFMRMAAHELKTPLTSMTGIVEGMLYQIGDFKDREYYLQACLDILEEQRRLVTDILSVSKSEHLREFASDKELFSLETLLLEEVFPRFNYLVEQKKIKFTSTLTEVMIYANRSDMMRICSNVVDNAIKYTEVDKQVIVRLTTEKFIVINECEPIKETDLEHVFEPFYRPDYARNRQDGGSGLGLYIVGQLAHRQGTNCTFQSSTELTGMEMVIDLTSLVQNNHKDAGKICE